MGSLCLRKNRTKRTAETTEIKRNQRKLPLKVKPNRYFNSNRTDGSTMQVKQSARRLSGTCSPLLWLA